MHVLNSIEINLDVDRVLRGMGTNPEVIRTRRQGVTAAAEWALRQGMPLLQPRVAYSHFDVLGLRHERLRLQGDRLMSGKLIAQHLGAASEIIAVICTIGGELEAMASQVLYDEPLYGFALDGLGTAAIEALANEAYNRFEEEAMNVGLETSLPLSPGMLGWEVEVGQRQLFSLVDSSSIGVSLTESSMMLPLKSLSMVVGLGRGLGEKGRTCDYCAFNETCRYQDHYSS
jgi:hypothetical protein